MEYNKDELINKIITNMVELPIELQRAFIWVTEHFDFVEAMCRETNMTEEELKRCEKEANKKEDYLSLVLLHTIRFYENIKDSNKTTN